MIVLAAATLSGCLHANAKSVVDSPPLDMPQPPPRIVETVEVVPPAPASLVEEPAHQPVRVPARQAPRAEPPRAESPKAEVPAESPKTAEDSQKPPTTLQTTPAVVEGEVERVIRSAIARANADLSRVDYRALSKDGKTQYDTAKRFIQQAENALEPRTRNLLFARNLADKASALAAQLSGR